MGEAKRRQLKDPNYGKPTIKIRSYQKSDYEKLVQIFDEVNPIAHSYLSPEQLKEDRHTFIENLKRKDTKIWIAEQQKEIVGFILTDNPDQRTRIVYISVSLKLQGQGIGKKLIEYVKKTTNYLKLAVYQNNKACEFYKKQGFLLDTENKITEKGFFFKIMYWKS